MAIIHLENSTKRITLFDRSKEDIVRGSLILRVGQELKKEPQSAGVNSIHPKGGSSVGVGPTLMMSKMPKKMMSPLDIQLQREREKQEINLRKLPELEKINKPAKIASSKIVRRPQIYMRALPSRFTISSRVVQKIGQGLAALCLIISLIGFGSVAFPLVVAETLSRLPKDKSLPENALAATLEPTPTSIPRKVNPYLDSDNLTAVVSQDFRIIIPKINIESIVIPNVDPLVEEKYKAELKNGVAHAQGSYLPGDSGGPVVLFAHSSDIIQNVIQYNAIFYEARNLEVGDEIYIIFSGKRYKYIVEDKKIIDPKELSEIWDSKSNLIISTCYPPGSDWKRLLIFAKLAS